MRRKLRKQPNMTAVLVESYTLLRQAAGSPELRLELPIGCTIHEVIEPEFKELGEDFRRLLCDEN